MDKNGVFIGKKTVMSGTLGYLRRWLYWAHVALMFFGVQLGTESMSVCCCHTCIFAVLSAVPEAVPLAWVCWGWTRRVADYMPSTVTSGTGGGHGVSEDLKHPVVPSASAMEGGLPRVQMCAPLDQVR